MNQPATARLAVLKQFALLMILLLSACTTVRGPESEFVDAPFDPERLRVEEEIDGLLRNPELKLGTYQEYYIGPGDELGITLVGRPDIFGEDQHKERFVVTVTESPMITLPLIGAIRVHGKTAQQIQEELAVAYVDFIQNPVPIVTIEKFHYNSVTVLGAVKVPGRYPLEFGDTLIDSIFKAGGLTFGGRTGNQPPGRYLKVYREKVDRKERIDLPMEELLDRIKEGDKVLPRSELIIPIEEFIISGNLEYNIPLQPNDIVYIPGAGTVIVHGPVRNPGVVFLGPSLRTLGQVLTDRGGLKYQGSSKVELVRTEANGSQTSWFLNGRDILAREAQDFYVQDEDQIFVYRHPVRVVLEALGSIFQASVSTGVSTTYSPIGP